MTCPECAAFHGNGHRSPEVPEQLELAGDDDWYAILSTISSEVPSRKRCQNWVKQAGVSGEKALDTVRAMHDKLRWDDKKKLWHYRAGGAQQECTHPWRLFQRWSKRNSFSAVILPAPAKVTPPDAGDYSAAARNLEVARAKRRRT